MSELSNYSIETDHLVWLSFKDGKNLRVPVGQLPRYLTPRDLQKVRRAMRLRRDFMRHHMPGTLIAVIGVGLLLAVLAGEQTVAYFWRHNHVDPESVQPTEIVRNIPLNSSPYVAPSPVTTPAGQPVAAVTRPTAARVKPVPTPPRANSKLKLPAVAVTPISLPGVPSPTPLPDVTPNPTPALPTPTPPPNAGQVLGDSTSPGDPAPTPPVIP
jgi:hypothetical protein